MPKNGRQSRDNETSSGEALDPPLTIEVHSGEVVDLQRKHVDVPILSENTESR